VQESILTNDQNDFIVGAAGVDDIYAVGYGLEEIQEK
jgi:hypothetical protein